MREKNSYAIKTSAFVRSFLSNPHIPVEETAQLRLTGIGGGRKSGPEGKRIDALSALAFLSREMLLLDHL